jgi:hypothetical protein
VKAVTAISAVWFSPEVMALLATSVKAETAISAVWFPPEVMALLFTSCESWYRT